MVAMILDADVHFEFRWPFSFISHCISSEITIWLQILSKLFWVSFKNLRIIAACRGMLALAVLNALKIISFQYVLNTLNYYALINGAKGGGSLL